ncbi:MAG: hypothetical protein U0350_51420 [Caldilineaceae bacterium]
MAQSIDILLDTDQAITDLAPTLNKLLDIDLQPIQTDGKASYAFRALTLTLDLYPFAAAQNREQTLQNYRYHISINGIFGSEQQRTKWTEDWAFGIMQKLKAQNYRLKRVDNL